MYSSKAITGLSNTEKIVNSMINTTATANTIIAQIDIAIKNRTPIIHVYTVDFAKPVDTLDFIKVSSSSFLMYLVIYFLV